ncbi:MAG: ergothioneine biosynthesis glutamate--cysteine ligase EgtA [Actinomycetota bacterium]
MTDVRDRAERATAQPLSEKSAEEHIHGICFKTGPPAAIGVELEWLVCQRDDPVSPVDHQRVTEALADLAAASQLPGSGQLTIEPGGQVEVSSAPAAAIGSCVTSTARDLAAVREAVQSAGFSLVGRGVDPYRPPARILDLPRYAAMEEFFDRRGPWGRVMMCSTASVQVSVDAGDEGDGPGSYRWRWRLLHAIGPILVAAFANSPLRAGRPTGWKSTRQAVWSRLDPGRTRAPTGAEPLTGDDWLGAPRGPADPRSAWAAYALDAEVLCIRRDDSQSWTAPPGLTFRDWLRGAGERPPTQADLTYHLSTLFPPVRPQGHFELRVIDAQPGQGWIVPAAVVSALVDDPIAAGIAMDAAETVWRGLARPAAPLGAGGLAGPWLRAARNGPTEPVIAEASRVCFAAAEAALRRASAPSAIRDQVSDFAETYVLRDRCPADDMLEESR